jgi:hypothetical protein
MYNTRIIQGEKRMRVRSLLAAAVLGAASLSANAAVVQVKNATGDSVPGAFVSSTMTPGTGAYAGFDIYRFFYAFDASSPPGSAGAVGLQSLNVTLETDRNFRYLEGQFAPPNSGVSNPDIDLYGAQSDDATYRTENSGDTTGTGIFIHDPDFDPWSVQGLFIDGVAAPATRTNSSTTNNPRAVFGPAKSIRVEGFVTNPPGGVGADPAARVQSNPNQEGAGALFAMAVIPTGGAIGARGQLSANAGPVLNFEIPIPEPTALGFVGLAGLALAGRRRRA